jgi:hypothetical protein
MGFAWVFTLAGAEAEADILGGGDIFTRLPQQNQFFCGEGFYSVLFDDTVAYIQNVIVEDALSNECYISDANTTTKKQNRLCGIRY